MYNKIMKYLFILLFLITNTIFADNFLTIELMFRAPSAPDHFLDYSRGYALLPPTPSRTKA